MVIMIPYYWVTCYCNYLDLCCYNIVWTPTCFNSVCISLRLLRGAPLRSARNLPSTPPELLFICIVRVYKESYVDSQNSLFCLLTCNNDHKSLYMPILWCVITPIERAVWASPKCSDLLDPEHLFIYLNKYKCWLLRLISLSRTDIFENMREKLLIIK